MVPNEFKVGECVFVGQGLTSAKVRCMYMYVLDLLLAGMDVRFSPYDDHEAILQMIQGWMDEAGEGCTIDFYQKSPKFPMTSTDDSDPWWRAFSSACQKM